jgi:hypothetical protein
MLEALAQIRQTDGRADTLGIDRKGTRVGKILSLLTILPTTLITKASTASRGYRFSRCISCCQVLPHTFRSFLLFENVPALRPPPLSPATFICMALWIVVIHLCLEFHTFALAVEPGEWSIFRLGPRRVVLLCLNY